MKVKIGFGHIPQNEDTLERMELDIGLRDSFVTL